MKPKSFIFFILIFIILPNISIAQIYNTLVEAKIEITSNGEFFQITGFSFNNTNSNKSLHYVLSVIKSDPNGTDVIKNDQKGHFILEPNQKKILSTTTINIGDKERTIVLLLVYDEDDKVLGKDRIVMNDIIDNEPSGKMVDDRNEISKDVTYSGADGVLLRGIVVENTKTKSGRDFYKKYSLEYLKIGINGEKIVTINELMALGSTTKIQLMIGDDVVVQFFVNPRSDYIDRMVDYSIKKTNDYFTTLRKNRNIVRRY